MKFPARVRAFVTGAGSGLGRGFAHALSRDGGRLLLSDINQERVEETAGICRAAGGEALAMRVDVSKLEDVETAAERMVKTWGGIDLLVNNAGIAAAGRVGEQSLSDWREVVGVNLWGPIHACHVFVPMMRRQGSGFIINVSASAAFLSLPEMGAYNVTKAALVSLSETLHAELAAEGIQVSALCPTFVGTNLMETAKFADPRQAQVAQAMFRRSKATVEEVVEAGLQGVLRNQLMVIPQLDGKLLWRLKRLAPSLYSKAAGKLDSRWLARLEALGGGKGRGPLSR